MWLYRTQISFFASIFSIFSPLGGNGGLNGWAPKKILFVKGKMLNPVI
jgi:hypothetical protein